MYIVEGLKEKAELQRLLHEEELALVSMGKALREAQFMNLQEQMKPHFLFNALNTIARSALLENASRTESLAMGLASLLRAALKETGSLSSLEDELSLAQAYLEFQHARFGDRLRWSIDVPDNLRNARIPRLMMQPLVENAVRHAIEPKLDGGAVCIKTGVKNGRLLIWVLDNGIGMSSIRLGEIRARVAASLEQKSLAGLDAVSHVNEKSISGIGIGLANLATRLGILYPRQCRFEIYSKTGRGTLVKVSIPNEEVGL
jgi:sensor histidine kinase YesM